MFPLHFWRRAPGSDVTRKVTTLARECGQLVGLEDVTTESLVPEAMRSLSSAQEFMARLPEVGGAHRGGACRGVRAVGSGQPVL